MVFLADRSFLLGKLLADPDPVKAARVNQAMLGMIKLIRGSSRKPGKANRNRDHFVGF
jgi:hypothetical protein